MNLPAQNTPIAPQTGVVGNKIPFNKTPFPGSMNNNGQQKIDPLAERAQQTRYLDRRRAIISLCMLGIIILNLLVIILYQGKYQQVLDSRALDDYKLNLIEIAEKSTVGKKAQLEDLIKKSGSVVLKDEDNLTSAITNYLKTDVFMVNRVQYPATVYLNQTNEGISSSISFVAPFENGWSIVQTLEKRLWLRTWGFAPVKVVEQAANSGIKLYNFEITIGISTSSSRN